MVKVTQLELKEARKQVNNLTNQLIGEKRVAQGHQNQMELNEQRQTMNVVSHAAKLGSVAQTKAESLAQSQLQKAQQFTMYSTNIGGMRRMASGGMQVPHMSMMNGIGGNFTDDHFRQKCASVDGQSICVVPQSKSII